MRYDLYIYITSQVLHVFFWVAYIFVIFIWIVLSYFLKTKWIYKRFFFSWNWLFFTIKTHNMLFTTKEYRIVSSFLCLIHNNHNLYVIDNFNLCWHLVLRFVLYVWLLLLVKLFCHITKHIVIEFGEQFFIKTYGWIFSSFFGTCGLI